MKPSKDRIAQVHDLLTLRSGVTHAESMGSPSTPVVVMVSGATLPMAVWIPLAERLNAKGLRTLRYDLPGRGHTPLDGRDGSFEDHLAQLTDVIETVKSSPGIHLVGLASGALVVAEYINRNPDQISSCTLIAPDGSETKFTIREKLLNNRVVGPLLFRIVGSRSLLSRIPRYAGSKTVRHFVRELLEFSLTASGFSTAVRSTVRTFPLHSGDQLYTALARSNTPVLVVWGAKDRITPPTAADAMRSLYGHESVRLMSDVGHLPFVEEPETVANLIYHHVYSSVA